MNNLSFASLSSSFSSIILILARSSACLLFFSSICLRYNVKVSVYVCGFRFQISLKNALFTCPFCSSLSLSLLLSCCRSDWSLKPAAKERKPEELGKANDYKVNDNEIHLIKTENTWELSPGFMSSRRRPFFFIDSVHLVQVTFKHRSK